VVFLKPWHPLSAASINHVIILINRIYDKVNYSVEYYSMKFCGDVTPLLLLPIQLIQGLVQENQDSLKESVAIAL
jgi:hypothetical protein